MLYRTLADMVLVVHVGLVIFALFGAFGVLKWRCLTVFHLPVALWSMAVMLTGGLDPLNPLEHWLRLNAGVAVEKMGVIEQYLTPLFFPTPLNRRFQIILGIIILIVNGAIYAWVYWRAPKIKPH